MQQDPQMDIGTESDGEPTPAQVPQSATTAELHDAPAANTADKRTRQDTSLLGRLLGSTVIGTLIYLYFGVFVALHVVLSVQFFLQALHPVIGIGAWIIAMVLGGLCVVALTVWREKVKTFWSGE